MDKVLNHKREEITLPDTLESLVAQLSIKAMQCIDSKNRERVFEFNDEEFEREADVMIRVFCERLLWKAANKAKTKWDLGHKCIESAYVDRESIVNTAI